MRLSDQIIDDTTTNVTFDCAQKHHELSCDQQIWLNNHYMKSIPRYKSLVNEYDKDITLNRRLKKFKVFKPGARLFS